jgi:hypothetical protein
LKALSYRLLNLADAYLRELGRLIDMSEAYGRSAPSAAMQGSAVKSVQVAYFDEIEKHVDQEPNIYKPSPKEAA